MIKTIDPLFEKKSVPGSCVAAGLEPLLTSSSAPWSAGSPVVVVNANSLGSSGWLITGLGGIGTVPRYYFVMLCL